jgi:phenylpropionate dioxygenase-like ring-hydroxylating dioxygenase large terminal subunit
MPVEAYTNHDWFLNEQQLIFQNLWQFVTPKMMVSKPDTFIRRKIAGFDVIIQNNNGKLSAFENVCAHRQSPIQNEHNGLRPLICPYHAWRYGENGQVINIPELKTAYRFTDEEFKCLKLKQFKIFEFGQLIFININENPINFWDQFDAQAVESLQRASELFDEEILVTCFKGNFNWKLAYENLRDSLHPKFLHARTVYKQVKFVARINESEIEEALRYFANGSANKLEHQARLRTFSGGGANEPMDNLPHYQWHDYVERFGTEDWYLNWLMFPNLHIASGSAGYSFIIEHHIPIAENQTDLWVYYVTAKKKRKYPTSAAVLIAHIEGAEKVLSEDISILENIQASLHSKSPSAMTGDFESFNMTIEKWYLDVMEKKYDV